MDDKNLIERTRQTAKHLFEGPVQVELPYQVWKEFDPSTLSIETVLMND